MDMKRFKIIAVIAVLVSLSFFTSNALAENQAGNFILTPFVGGYVFDEDQDLDNGPVFGIGLGYNYTKILGVEGIFNYIDSESDRTGDDVDGYIFRVDGLYHFMPDEQLVPYVAAGIGAISINGDHREDNTNAMINYGAGIKYFITESLALRGDVRHILDFDGTNNNLIYTIGLAYLFGEKETKMAPQPMDSDGDGVNNNIDQCPDTPKGVSVDSVGCPRDSDGDGVYDYKDQCPDTPAGVSVDKDGCPLDSDGDGVYDYKDKCPDTSKGVSVDSVGCPRDSDGDGVYDYKDQCPDTPASAPVDSVGCPLDSDGDGVYDYLDECPGTLPQITVDDKGCPVAIKEKVSIDLKVEFAFNSAAVKSIYDEHIEKVVNFLKTYHETLAVIEGHTDSIGSEAYNLRLSQKRAESVMQHLVKYGIDSSRLKAAGYGESRPIADNSTKEGQQRNRRVIAVISTIITKQ